ncbi:hypothetical protein ScPMuIL_008021 [Solemya velum]
MFSYFMFKPPSSSPTNNRDKSSASSLRYNTSISQSRILLTTALSLSRYRLLLHAENSLKLADFSSTEKNFIKGS